MTDTISESTEVTASPEQVWAMVSDLPRMGEWSPEATGGSWKGGADRPAVGVKFIGRNRNGWHRWSTTSTVVECEPGRTFAFEVTSGPVSVAQWRYDIEPTDDGCRVTESWTDRRPGWFRAITAPIVGVRDRAERNAQNMRTTLERLSAAAEAER